MIVGDFDSVSDAALRAGAELLVHAYPDGERPGRGAPAPARARRSTTRLGAGISEDLALLLAHERGAS